MLESKQKLEQILEELKSELKNFEDIATHIKPNSGDIPQLNGIDIYGETIPLNRIGGDHIIYLDFNKRYDLDTRIENALKDGRTHVADKLKEYKHTAGVMLADVAGHKLTDAALAAMLHQAFMVGVLYELDHEGTVTTHLFENLNTRFHMSSSISKYITMIYGEVSDQGVFRFLSAAHPFPLLFSNKFNRLIPICTDRVTLYPPIGTLVSEEDVDKKRHKSPLGFKVKYKVNEIRLLGTGDLMIISTDGFSEHENTQGQNFVETRLEDLLIGIKEKNAHAIYNEIKKDMLEFSDPKDDISFIVIKKDN